ncbi:Hypothetical_protein [Hexamita inflata]|uniref:Hypothetical_protein n=1 Tax=Hexamita inflata TaxID=28002 RepID=A0AA86Q2Q0_9EUKA|nr:Hypothetical protein HINF_LOCUS31899 [Hexamita inflata]CAI9963573.1 Hypothetical protein HINF_LOCUS51218 [Hexamita inflata]
MSQDQDGYVEISEQIAYLRKKSSFYIVAFDVFLINLVMTGMIYLGKLFVQKQRLNIYHNQLTYEIVLSIALFCYVFVFIPLTTLATKKYEKQRITKAKTSGMLVLYFVTGSTFWLLMGIISDNKYIYLYNPVQDLLFMLLGNRKTFALSICYLFAIPIITIIEMCTVGFRLQFALITIFIIVFKYFQANDILEYYNHMEIPIIEIVFRSLSFYDYGYSLK